MHRIKTITVILIIASITSHNSWANSSWANSDQSPSKRIKVYSLSQNYWDTKYGETLGEIVHKLLPYNKTMQQQLALDIMELNPDVFLNNNPNRMQANKRLWLPNNMVKADTQVDQTYFSVQSFSWGNIKRPRR